MSPDRPNRVAPPDPRLSVVTPVVNERTTVEEIRVRAVSLRGVHVTHAFFR